MPHPELERRRVYVCPLEKLLIKGLINEGEYEAGLWFQKLSRKIGRVIASPQLSRVRLENPQTQSFHDPNEAYDEKIERQWKQAWKALLRTGQHVGLFVESIVVDEREAFKTVRDLKTLKAGLQALEEEFAREF